ncbi:DUF1697 domain-containing protein [Capnocytophaga canimorsus]|uniref:DUF1697 domain-containing protein n=2 Tax=Capnocytophaga canimorsus TaxID=28188 RepID=F9YUJ6_CAPCC|nr:DUF1697 domain-containing protein [Capnocytophaga canimorsus]AEK24233.1 Conserved hypothetical protein [Capnocytophaga canimorsus Cc5]CEN45463.1 conserved hypothetical protein [Capnocytophaga canimorsus]VEJ19258.1 Uncharacterized protein conserved in bacteria [Capnocytophaga canimorsus]
MFRPNIVKTKNMNTYIVLLRGVMPTGKNKIPSMAFLKEILGKGGFVNVKTYIQSGNVVLQTELSPAEVSRKVHEVIKENIGAELPVIVKTADEIAQVLSENPFTENHESKRVFFTLFNDELSLPLAKELKKQDFGEEQFDFTEKALYMYLPKDASRSKLSNNFLEKKLNITATTRNFNTLTKLVALAEENI